MSVGMGWGKTPAYLQCRGRYWGSGGVLVGGSFSHITWLAQVGDGHKLGGSSGLALCPTGVARTVGVAALTPSPPHAGLLPPQHPEEHGVHVSPGQELHHQQGDPQPLPVLPPAEVLRSGHVQGV